VRRSSEAPAGDLRDALGWWGYALATVVLGLLVFVGFGWVVDALFSGHFVRFIGGGLIWVVVGLLCIHTTYQAAACDKRRGGIWTEPGPPKESWWYDDDE
jgi:hypothetical protein